MLSIEHIREHPDEVRASLKTRGEEDSITEVLELDAQIRAAITERDDLNAERNRVSRELGQARSQGQGISEDARAEMRKIGDHADVLNEKTKELGDKLNKLMLDLPNLPQADVPVGEDESGSVIIRQNGEPPVLDFTPKPHWELGEELGIIDFERGTKLAGSRFYNMMDYGPKL
ncbi:MAG: serine--tRNA ligase, partial [Chloroflexota bacterium]|nr:serine--tRNA ligase [Chloroflexota bacterium]